MDELPDIARIAHLLSDAARARIVWTLIDGTTRPAGELAYAANISAQSASAHLAKLVRGGPDVAGTVEGMASWWPARAHDARAPQRRLPASRNNSSTRGPATGISPARLQLPRSRGCCSEGG